MTTADYIYKRKDGGETYCYGEVVEGSNFNIVCEDEWNDGVLVDYEGPKGWYSVCKYLEKQGFTDVEQIEAC